METKLFCSIITKSSSTWITGVKECNKTFLNTQNEMRYLNNIFYSVSQTRKQDGWVTMTF